MNPDLLHFEDFKSGQRFDLGTYKVTAEEIVEFAREFDPQPQHLSDEAARQTILGGLAASGWHSCAMAMRLLVDGLLNRSASLGGLSVDEARWLKPVRPGDVLRGTAEVLETKASSKGGRGYVKIKGDIYAGETRVMSLVTWPIFAMRKPS